MTKDQTLTADEIRAERLRRGWNQTELGYRARLSATDISRIETGRLRPYPQQLARIVRAFGQGA